MQTPGVAMYHGCFCLYYVTGMKQGGTAGVWLGVLSCTGSSMRHVGGVTVHQTWVVVWLSCRFANFDLYDDCLHGKKIYLLACITYVVNFRFGAG